MKILWITLESIFPPNTGGRIGVYKRLEQIAKTEEIYLFYPYDNEEEVEYVEKLEKYCEKVFPYSRQKNKMKGFVNIWRYPFTVSSRKIPKMEEDIQKCIEEYKIDIINVDFPHMCACLSNLKTDIPIILNEHNLEWKVYRTIANSQENIIKKLAYFVDSFRLKSYEKKVFEKLKFSKVTFVSSKDMQYMVEHQFVNQDNAVLIPVGADKQPDIEHKSTKQNIIFVGKMSYGPNIEAVNWFVQEVMPILIKENSSLKFYIVGKDPTNEVKRLKSKNVIVTGMVEDVSKFYELADLVVLPLKNGGGVKVKLLEAISYRKPIVSTTVGVEGTYYANHFIPVTDDPIKFANYCKNILNSADYYHEKEVYEYFILNYTWKHIGDKYLNMFQEVLDEKS